MTIRSAVKSQTVSMFLVTSHVVAFVLFALVSLLIIPHAYALPSNWQPPAKKIELYGGKKVVDGPAVNSMIPQIKEHLPDVRQTCKEGDTTCEAKLEVPSGEKRRLIISRPPDNQILNSGAFIEKINQSITSQATMKSVAIRMVEPAIEASRASIDLQGAVDTANIYAAQEAFVAEANIDLDTRDVVLESARGCQTKKLKDGESWQGAALSCLGANGQKSFEGDDSIDSPANPENADAASADGPQVETEKNALTLSDTLFGTLITYYSKLTQSGLAGSEALAPEVAITSLKELRKVFIQYVGDYKYTVGAGEGASDPIPGTTEAKGMILPRTEENKDYEPHKLFATLTQQTLVVLTDLMRKNCEWNNRAEIAADAGLDDNYNPFDPKYGDFWSYCDQDEKGKCKKEQDEKKQFVESDVIALSTFGWEFDRTTGDMLYQMVSKDLSLRKEGKIDCNLIGVGIGKAANGGIDFLELPTKEDGESVFSSDPSNFKDFINPRLEKYLYFAKLIAYGKQIDNLADIQFKVFRLSTIGNSGGPTWNLTMEMFNRASLAKDGIVSASNRNSALLRAFVLEMKSVLERETGTGARQLGRGRANSESLDAPNSNPYGSGGMKKDTP